MRKPLRHQRRDGRRLCRRSARGGRDRRLVLRIGASAVMSKAPCKIRPTRFVMRHTPQYATVIWVRIRSPVWPATKPVRFWPAGELLEPGRVERVAQVVFTLEEEPVQAAGHFRAGTVVSRHVATCGRRARPAAEG